MRSARLPRSSLALVLLGLMGGCASARAERVYVAPTNHTVTSGMEATWDGRGQHIYVENRSSVQVVVTSLSLESCENVKNPCGVKRLNMSVSPGQRLRIGTVLEDNPNRGYNFRYGWTWEPKDPAPAMPST